MSTRTLFAVILASMPWMSLSATAADEGPVFDVPRLEAVTIDGDLADWNDAGFRIDVLAGAGETPSPSDFAPSLRLGWDDRGLLVLLRVRDDESDEADDAGQLWRKDGVELFLADRRGGAEMIQVMLAPGLSEAFPALRSSVHDKRSSAELRAIEYEPQAARTRIDGGYVMEVLLPWEGLGVEPALGAEAGFQVYVSDADGERRYRTQWAEGRETANNTQNMNRLRLADEPSEPVTAVAAAAYDEWFGGIDVSIILAGEGTQTVELLDDGVTVATQVVELADGRGVAVIRLPIPARGQGARTLDVRVDGRTTGQVAIADADVVRARHIARLAPTAKPAVFATEALPEIEFSEPTWAERLIGRYTIKTTYYNRDQEVVETAEAPGRYGAIATITGEHGDVLTRFVTLYRATEDYKPWDDMLAGQVMLPADLGIDAAVVAAQQRQVLDQLTWAFADHGYAYDWTARLLAGLSETPSDAGLAGSHNDAEALNRQWWVTLKRELNGNAERWTTPLQRPQAVSGAPAPVLREGAPEEAGMAPDAAERIDAVLTEWSADTDEAFIALVARHGVIVLHKAYGERDGEPMTTQTRSWMASLTKLISGTAMMMLVDQGLISLDDPVEKYLPALPERDHPATLHHLMTHTAGMWGHWGDEESDLEHRVAELYPYLAVGQQHEYNGMSLALGTKVIEQVTGEAMPQFYRRHLTGPLGMDHTYINDAAGGARSIALDMARLGQMLLNKGAYGEHRFMSEATFEQMLPRKLDALLGPDTEVVWGIGCVWFPGDGLSDRTFGHGAASSATLRIDLENGLVISMTRNAAGKNHGKYHPRFIQTVADCIVK